MELIILLICFLILLVIGLPIAFNLLISSFVYLLVSGNPLILIPQKVFEGTNSFVLLAVPFFVLTGQIMLRGNLLNQLIDFTNAFFGHVRGSIALLTVGSSLLMGSIVGLAVASAASLGSFLIPMMKDEGYTPAFSSAVMSSASLLGPIMPPSVLMILYVVAVGKISIAGLFMAAIVPALLITAAQMISIYFISKKRKYPKYEKTDWPEKWAQFRKAGPILLLPVIILGGIFGGVFSISEASAVAVLYSAFLAFVVKRSMKLRDLPKLFIETALTSGLVIILASTATVTAWAIANEQVVQSLIGVMTALPVWVFLLLIIAFLLLAGMFMDDYASIVILAPIIAPIAMQMGIDPLHIATIICVTLVIGLATPPFGIALFVTSPIAGVTIEETFKEALPMMTATVGVLIFITFFPQAVLFLPNLLGY